MSGRPLDEPPRLAVHCTHLLRPSSRGVQEPETLCGHPARDGRKCIGPFLHDLPTDCGFWEPHPERHLIAAPMPGGWQGRRQRMQRGW